MEIFSLSPDFGESRVVEALSEALQRTFHPDKSVETVRRRILELVKRDESRIIVALDDQRDLVGTLSLHKSPVPGQVIASDFYISDVHRRRGLGTRLAGYGIRQCKSYFGAESIAAQVYPDAPAWLIRFYESLGFLKVQNKYVLFI